MNLHDFSLSVPPALFMNTALFDGNSNVIEGVINVPVSSANPFAHSLQRSLR